MQGLFHIRSAPSAIWRYGLAVALVAASLTLTLLLESAFSNRFWFLFLATIMATAWFGGRSPGWLAAILSMLAVDYFLLPPSKRFTINSADIPFLVTFAASAFGAAWISSSLKQTQASLKQARNELETRVEERTAELRKSNEALRESERELARLSRVLTIGELATSIAHEVNQPLAAVVTNGDACLRWLAAEPPNLSKARESVEWIIKEGNRASEIIQRIRDLSKRATAQKAPLDFNELIREVVALLSAELERNHVVLQTALASDLPPVLGDRIQLQQVVLNLMMNGVEAMHTVTERPRELRITSKATAGDRVLVAVSDCGIGLAPDLLDHIFEAFVTTKHDGIGMGLSISRTIVESHGGRLWATANSTHGATFQFILPAATETAP